MNLSSKVKNIKESVDAAIQSSNWSSGITIYDKEIKNSSDALQTLAEGTEKYQQEEKDYCHLHILKAELLNLNEQKKSSKNVYVDCSEDPHCSKYIEMWKSYTDFYIKQNKDEKARQVFKSSLEKLSDKDKDQMLYIWLSFEQKHGHPNYKIDDLLNENQDQSGDELTPVLDTIIPPLAGNVLVVKSNSTLRPHFDYKRSHRPLCLFQFDDPSGKIKFEDHELINIPTPVLYAIGFLIQDPSVFVILENLRKMQKKTLENLDNGQKEYDCISLLSCSKELVHWRQPEGLTDKKAIDIQYGAYMQKCYHEETKIINTMIEYQQQKLKQIGVPGFVVSKEKEDIELQRYIIKLIEYTQRKIKENQS